MLPTDTGLIDAVLQGDKEAFSLLVERHMALVRYVIARYTSDEILAQDLFQETLLESYLSLERLQDKTSFRAWMCSIARHICLMYFRRQKIKTVSLDVYGGIDLDQVLWDVSVEETAERLQLRWTLREAVAQLSEKNRQVVWLFYFEDYSLEDTADLLGITVNTVKGRLHRARQQLREALSRILLTDPPTIKGEVKMTDTTLIPVQLIDVILRELKLSDDQTRSHYQLILFDPESRRAFIIWIGEYEGLAIAQQMNGQQMPRPMTHLLMSRLIETTGAALEQVEISSLKDEVYYATVVLRVNGETVRVDARPSDALGLAVYTNTPLFADESVFEAAGCDIPAGASPTRGGLQEIDSIWQQRIEADTAHRQQLQDKPETQRLFDHEAESKQAVSKAFGVEV